MSDVEIISGGPDRESLRPLELAGLRRRLIEAERAMLQAMGDETFFAADYIEKYGIDRCPCTDVNSSTHPRHCDICGGDGIIETRTPTQRETTTP